MSAIDIGIIVFALALAAIGWERGLIGSAMPLAGFIGGVAAGARIGPALLEGGSESPYAPAVAAAGGNPAGNLPCDRSRRHGRRDSGRAWRTAAPAGSSIRSPARCCSATLALAAAWVFGAVALNAPGNDARGLREAVQRSSILVALNDAFPPSGPLLNALRRIDPTPDVRGPEANVEAPDGSVTDDPDVERAAASVLRVRGSACGLGVEGSGWIAGARDRRHERARRRGPGRHHGDDARRRRARDGRPALRATERPCGAGRPRPRPARRSRSLDGPRHGTAGGGGGLSGGRPAHRQRGTPGANRDRDQRGLVRARSDRAAHDPVPRPGQRTATRAARSSTRTAAC